MICVIDVKTNEKLNKTKSGYSSTTKTIYPEIDGVFRVVRDEGYTHNFGMEWNLFQRTQIDTFSGLKTSENRFFTETNWPKNNFENQNILEVGSGAGRFTQIILDHTKANLYSVDYSSAVDANYKNNGPHERLQLFQASIYELPFAPHQFDKVICFGVLQHTPDVKKSVEALTKMLKPGGELIVDFYPYLGWYTKFNAKYWLRPWTVQLQPDYLLQLIRKNVDWLIKWSRFNSSIGLSILNRFIPICDIDKTLPTGLSKEALKEWIILDTFDIYSPTYDQPQKLSDVAAWFKEFGLTNIDAQYVTYEGNLTAAVVKGLKP
ncbi:MAG: class I SAM-dependent methyltransferase [Cytophagaceae bacterium]|jgi:SAM-dependent methyltransferase|nr:class I SAM-dependent methyltransferase [Cytophagaceae bacterium]